MYKHRTNDRHRIDIGHRPEMLWASFIPRKLFGPSKGAKATDFQHRTASEPRLSLQSPQFNARVCLSSFLAKAYVQGIVEQSHRKYCMKAFIYKLAVLDEGLR
jgi:hypothetical protein